MNKQRESASNAAKKKAIPDGKWDRCIVEVAAALLPNDAEYSGSFGLKLTRAKI